MIIRISKFSQKYKKYAIRMTYTILFTSKNDAKIQSFYVLPTILIG